MEFFIPCWIALGNMFPQEPSVSTVSKYSGSIAKRLDICNRVGRAASKSGVDPLLAISIAFAETRFSFVQSAKNAKGPMGVIGKYHCQTDKKISECDLIEAGVRAIQTCLDLSEYDYCSALALYNRGMYGKCTPGRSEYNYARHVLDIYAQICAASDACHSC